MSIKYGSKEFRRDFGPLTIAKMLMCSRDDLELTQAEMAKKLNVSKQRVCDFEKGRRLPSAKSLIEWDLNEYSTPDFWLTILIEDQFRRDGIDYEVKVSDKKRK